MLCEKCMANTANLHLSQIINGEKTELHVCTSCAAKMGYLGSNSMFMDLFFNQIQPPVHPPCPGCRMTYEKYKNIRRFGCEKCYTHFSKLVEPILQKVHHSTAHRGKVPKSLGGSVEAARRLEDLRRRLEEAIQQENYELAAKLRDKIRETEGKK